MNRISRLSVALGVAGVLGVAAPATASATTTVTISGATASYPLVSLLAQKYVKLFPHKVKFKIAQGGAQIGVNDVAAGRVTIGDVSRDPLPADPAGLVFYPIAKYGICVVTNKANTLSNLTPAQVALDLYRQDTCLEQSARRHGERHDRPDQPHLGGRRADQLPDTAARRQESTEPLASRTASEGLLRASRKRPERDRLPVQLPGRPGRLNSVGYNGVPCNETTVRPQDSTRVPRGSTR